MADTLGQRFFAVRLALGDGVRDPMPMREFVALVKKRTKRVIHVSELSEIERDLKKRIDVNDVAAVAAVDPQGRGRDWLAWGSAVAPREVRIEVNSTEPVPESDTSNGVSSIQQPPEKPPRLSSGRRRGKDDRPVQKKPPR